MFEIKIKLNSTDIRSSLKDRFPSYDPNLENVNSLLSDLCVILHEEELIDFLVSGFGDSEWPVDVGTDLCTILEQLPDAIDELKKCSGDFELHFYEQGLQRRLEFKIQNDDLIVFCTSGTDWQPNPYKVKMNKKTLYNDLVDVYKLFKNIAKQICPKLTSHEWFEGY